MVFIDLEHGDVEGYSAEVVDRYGLALLFHEIVTQSSVIRLVTEPEDFVVGGLTSILGFQTL